MTPAVTLHSEPVDAVPVLVDFLPVLVDSLPAGSAACSGRGWKLALFLDCTGR